MHAVLVHGAVGGDVGCLGFRSAVAGFLYLISFFFPLPSFFLVFCSSSFPFFFLFLSLIASFLFIVSFFHSLLPSCLIFVLLFFFLHSVYSNSSFSLFPF